MADGDKAATAYTIGWEPQPGPQTALLACPVFEVFFGGAARGGKARHAEGDDDIDVVALLGLVDFPTATAPR